MLKKFGSLFALVFAFLFVGILAYAQVAAPPETVEGATSLVGPLIQAIVAGNYNVVGGIVLMILMVAVRQYALPKWEISSDLLPFATAIIGALGLVGLSVTNGGDWGTAAKNGLTMAIFAGGAWSLLGKYIAKMILGSSYVETDVDGKAVEKV